MVKNLNLSFGEKEFEEIKNKKEILELTWEEAMKKGVNCLYKEQKR